jgi:hypothetical protein
VETERAAFVKIYTSFKQELKDIDGGDLKVWIYLALSINRYTKDARPGLRKIAEDTGMAVNTVRATLERLELRGLLDIVKEDGKGNLYHPSDYVSVSKTDTVTQTVSKSDGTVSKNEGTVSVTRRDSAQLEELEELEKEPPLSEKDYEFVNKKVDKILEYARKSKDLWKGRDYFSDNHLAYADWYHDTTNQICGKPDHKSWQKCFGIWKDYGLEIKHLQEAYNQDIKWKQVISDPNELTKKAVAIKAMGEVKKTSTVSTFPKIGADGRVIDDN